MWIPKDISELLMIIDSGTLVETATFDAKRNLDPKSRETAKDIAAMANDGGVIIYGVGEDEHKKLTLKSPVVLKGFVEKIASIVDTCIAERPFFHQRIYVDPEDNTRGYVAIIVPPSERAPHMVIVENDNRFYIRQDTISVPMKQNEVARFYERRQRWQIDRDAYMQNVIGNMPVKGHPNVGTLCMYARPIGMAINPEQVPQKLFNSLVEDASHFSFHNDETRHMDSVNLLNLLNGRPRGFGYLFESESYPYTKEDSEAFASTYGAVEIDHEGACHFYYGGVVSTSNVPPTSGSRYFDALYSINLALQFLLVVGKLFEALNYYGVVDIGLAVTSTHGAVLRQEETTWRTRFANIAFPRSSYQRTSGASAAQLKEPNEAVGIIEYLLLPLIQEITKGKYNPFKVNEIVAIRRSR